jgi:hypothetical protein
VATAPHRRLPAFVLVILLLAAPAASEELPTVELVPDDRAGWTLTNLFAPITGFFLGGPGYWYSPRRVEVRTTPPGATLDLFYVRRSFQKGFEQADAPVAVMLPSRNEAGPYDSLRIRAQLDGYQQKEVTVPVRSRQKEVLIELEPLANSLIAVTHLYFAGRSMLGFLTEEAPTFRMQRGRDDYSLVLIQTGASPEAAAAMAGVRDALVSELRPQQLGEDLVVRIALAESVGVDGIDLRQRQSYDAVRRLHRFTLDVVPAEGGPSPVQRAKAALARIDPAQVGGCALRFDQALRQQLDSEALARALAPSGAFTDPYLREALKRLGELSPGGVVTLLDGTSFDTGIPLELAAAASQASEVQGFLAMLRAFVAELEPEAYRRATLQGLIAPELTPDAFVAATARAEAAERNCRAS